MDVRSLQERVGVPADGIAGLVTWCAVLVAMGARGAMACDLATPLALELPNTAINTRLRICHFLAQAAHESDGFKTLTEYGPPSYFAKYDGRADLGNTEPGDGARFKGRGIFQITGRANYERYSKCVPYSLVTTPEMAANPSVAVRTATAYWSDRGLSEWADRDDCRAITKRINGGYNGLAERLAYLAKIKGLWPT